MYIYRRPKSPYYWTEFWVGSNRIRRSTKTSSRRDAAVEARRIRNEAAAEAKAKPVKPATALTVGQACGQYWIEHGKRLKAARDERRNLKYITTFIDKNMPLAELSNRHVNTLVKKRREMGAGPRGVNSTLATLQNLMNRAAGKWEESVKAIVWRDHKLKVPKERVRWITEEEAQRLINCLEARAEHIAYVAYFLLLTGVRKDEAFNATWDRFNEAAATITLRVKGGHDREVPLSTEAMTLLRSLEQKGRYVFDTTNHRKHFARALKEAGISDFRWHDLRHTVATWLGLAGTPLEVVSKTLGHSGIAVTMKYRHVIQREVRDGLQKLPTLGTHTSKIVGLRGRLSG